MNINFEGCNIKNQKIVENNSQTADIINELKKEINEILDKDFVNRVMPIINDLEKEQKSGRLKKADTEKWLQRLKDTVTIGGGLATLSNASWWEHISNMVKAFFDNLQN